MRRFVLLVYYTSGGCVGRATDLLPICFSGGIIWHQSLEVCYVNVEFAPVPVTEKGT
jgi:hypothetical protein